jgi:hypothetical protein
LHPAECANLSDAQLAELAVGFLKRTDALRLSVADEILLYCELGLFLGPDFETHVNWAHSIFADEATSVAERLRIIHVTGVIEGVLD